VQREPITPMLKSPGIMRFKPKYDEPPSNFAINFNLRRYTVVFICSHLSAGTKAGRCRFTPALPRVARS